MHTLICGKKKPNNVGYSYIFPKILSRVNIHRLGEKSPNLVTLVESFADLCQQKVVDKLVVMTTHRPSQLSKDVLGQLRVDVIATKRKLADLTARQ
jgi:hypothetical protein